MKTINQIMNLRLMALLFAVITIVSCSDDDDDGVTPPDDENDVEVITNVTLIFTPTAGGVPVTASAIDGDGIDELEVSNAITLAADTEYTLTYNILNDLDPNDLENIGEEILEEDNEHQLFYSFTNDAFASPMGDGNIDTASDPLNYNDQDENENNVGLSTSWTTGSATSDGTFRARLQHQPGIKTATTGANDGDTDFDLTFVLNIQ